MESLHKHLDPDYLPADYDGCRPKIDYSSANWYPTLSSIDDHLKGKIYIGVALENFLEPCEQDLDLLLTYLKALGLGRVKETFCPVLYKVAVHHVATFVHLYADQPPSKRFRKMIDALGNQNLKNELLSYCNAR